MATILVVEDDALSRDVVIRRLRWEGYGVLEAIDGANAISIAQNERPDLILMDVGLPGINGWEATRVIKQDEATRRIPIIILTAYETSAQRRISYEVGCDAFMTKPASFSTLFSTIRHCLGAIGDASAS
ncbi:MAG TPA: response regulator [Kouleothrix sp.]|uniref:response regulator n=1 Tax=Kouleothrix sp. TaxID=2779161 RepID=UPI002B56C004|nr:response regulator [Kouleothrix sp.]